jgi:hypothetical protein
VVGEVLEVSEVVDCAGRVQMRRLRTVAGDLQSVGLGETTVIWTLLFSCMSSVRNDDVKPLMACLAPQ